MDKILTIEQLAEYLQVSTKTVYRMVKNGEVPCIRVSGQWRFREERIQQWLRSKEQNVEDGIA